MTTTGGSGVRVGLGLAPSTVDLDRARLLDQLRRIEETSIDHVAVTDHVAFRGGRGWDGVSALTYLAGLGIDRPLHTGVLILPLRHPTILARQLLDLADRHAPGVVAGVGLGGDDPEEFSMVGMRSTERGSRMDDAVDLLGRLLGEQQPVDVDGHYPAAGPGLARGEGERVRIVVGGRAGAAHRRAAAADGWLATFCSAFRFAEGRAAVAEAADGAAPPCSYQAWVGVGADARGEADRTIQRFYGLDPEPFHRYTPAGSAEEIAAALVPYVEAGCESFNLFAAAADPEEAVDTIAEVATLLH